jgi:hypothetical protein
MQPPLGASGLTGSLARKLRSVARMMRDRGFATLHDMLSTFGQSGARVLWDERFAVAGLGGFENTDQCFLPSWIREVRRRSGDCSCVFVHVRFSFSL